MDDKKKKFVVPEAEIVNFIEDDIITASTQTEFPYNWSGDDTELWG